MKKIMAIILVCLFIPHITPVMAAESASGLTLSAPSALLMDQMTGTVLYEKNAHEKRPIASVTKIMTMLLTMEAIDRGEIKMDDVVTVSEHAKSMGGSTIYLETGEQMSVHDILKGIAVMSANDGCVAMAEHIAGSEEEFVEQMNARAKSLNMNDTHFSNTNGLVDENHYSTAYDVALMSRELLKHDKISEFTTIWMDSLREGKFQLANTNKLIKYYQGATGLKTGYTQKSMYCVAASATRDNMSLISVVLGAPSSKERFADASSLLNYGFNGFSVKTGVEKGKKIANMTVQKGKSNMVLAKSGESFSLLVKKTDKTALTYQIKLQERIVAPIKKGETVGEMIFYQGKRKAGSVPVIVDKTISRENYTDVFLQIMRYWINDRV